MSGEGEAENELLLAERFGTVFVIGLLTNLLHGDVTMESCNTNANLLIRRSCIFKQQL
jgi:hypothetical protein